MEESNFDHQGKSKEQLEASTVGCFIAGIGLVVVTLWLIIANL